MSELELELWGKHSRKGLALSYGNVVIGALRQIVVFAMADNPAIAIRNHMAVSEMR